MRTRSPSPLPATGCLLIAPVLRSQPHASVFFSLSPHCKESGTRVCRGAVWLAGRYIVQELAGGGELFDIVIQRVTKAEQQQQQQQQAIAAGSTAAAVPPPAPFTEREASKLVSQIVGAIQHCHDRGVMHRDLKPENVLVSAHDENQLKLCDFGLAGPSSVVDRPAP